MNVLARFFFGATLLLSPAVSHATPIVVTGFGDSITCDGCNDGSYLQLLATAVGTPVTIEDQGFSALQTGAILSNLQTWLGGSNTADYLILFGGTVDAFQVGYNQTTTLTNIQQMVTAVVNAGIPLVLLAPPPVVGTCNNPGPPAPTCATIDASLASLAPAIGTIASSAGVPFIDLYQAFTDDPNTTNLFRPDGLHPKLATGDQLIANLVAAHVPEPSTAALMGMGLLGLLTFSRNANA